MKKLLSGVITLVIISFCYSQEIRMEIKEIPIEGVTVSPVPNGSYRNLAYLGVVSSHVKKLEDEAARYDVSGAPGFNGGLDDFKVIFRQLNGYIEVRYANNGNIIRTSERYKNIVLPMAVRRAACLKYPDYAVNSTNYFVSYKGENTIKKRYHVQMKKDNEHKNLEIDMEGNILN